MGSFAVVLWPKPNCKPKLDVSVYKALLTLA